MSPKPVLTWVWQSNERILSFRRSRLGHWETYREDHRFQLILYPTHADLFSRVPKLTPKVFSRPLRSKLMEQRKQAADEERLAEFLEQTRQKMEASLLVWAETYLLTPMQLLEASI